MCPVLAARVAAGSENDMKVGYARVSTETQTAAPQIAKLEAAGCDRIYTDEGWSGTKASRPQWDKALASLESGDCLCSVRLDRFGRSVRHLFDLSADLNARGVDLQCTDQAVDTTSSVGKFTFGLLACVAAFERDIISERTKDGLAIARDVNGKTLGRPPSLSESQVKTAQMLRRNGESVPVIAATMGVPQSTLYRALKAAA